MLLIPTFFWMPTVQTPRDCFACSLLLPSGIWSGATREWRAVEQIRPGRGGRPFRIRKFRTMSDERDEHGELLPDEVRLGRFGTVMRATSLDELPELLNVLKGEMSIVGPRPLLMEYLALYSDEQARRHDVRPGITGLAQVNGRNTQSWDERFADDVWYVDHRSLRLDISIIATTVLQVLRREDVAEDGHVTRAPFEGNEAGS